MPTDSNRYLATAAGLLLALSLFCAARPADGACTGTHSSSVPASITIRAPLTVAAGGTLCFEVVSLGGPVSISVELNEIVIPYTIIEPPAGGPGGPGTPMNCAKIPPGCVGSEITITAVGPGGTVATATVIVV
jgi:hypothetical protein